MKMTLYGRPITKKNSSRVVRCGNFTKILPSKAFTEYEKDCLKQITGEQKKVLSGRYNLCCVYYMPTRHRVDLVNLLEATCDILVKAGVIKDDNSSIVASHDGSRVLYDRENPRVEIEIVKSTLAPSAPVSSRFIIGKDAAGKVKASEYAKGVIPGQDQIDSETGEIIPGVVDFRTAKTR